MGLNFTGYVINGARAANSNADSTALPVSGVLRDVKPLNNCNQEIFGQNPSLIDLHGDMYRAAILNSPLEGTTEYLIWAANSSHLSIVAPAAIGPGDPWLVTGGSNSIPQGTLTAIDSGATSGHQSDGTTHVIVQDSGNRSISDIYSVTIHRGDTNTDHVLVAADFASVDEDAGLVVVLTSVLHTLFGDALSSRRGDYVVSASYFISSSRFYWTRNDPLETRFGWSNTTQRWEPYKGGSVIDLGIVTTGTYKLTPRPSGITIGDYLPGSTTGDAYSMLRVGITPNSSSTPIAFVSVVPPGSFSGIRVVADDEATSSYDFASTELAGILAVSQGTLVLNPAFVATFAGLTLWYSPRSFKSTGTTGVLGELLGASENPIFIAPIPQPGQYPFIKIGSRRYLGALVVDTEADLAALNPTESQVGVALSTGQLLFNSNLIKKADPSDVLFDVEYLGANVIYDGVAFCQQTQPARAPMPLTDSAGFPALVSTMTPLYVPDADLRGTDGLGLSGILHEPDGTGALADVAAGVPTSRPGGDTFAVATTGLVRKVKASRPSGESLGDTFIFGADYALETITEVTNRSFLPILSFMVEGGTAYIAKDAVSFAPNVSLVALSKKDLETFGDQYLYFEQAIFTPAMHTDRPRVVSKLRDTFTLAGTEHLYFGVDGVFYDWDASVDFAGGGTATTDDLVASINAIFAPGATAYAQNINGFLILGSTGVAGMIEIAFGAGGVRDISGCTALGILPGWRAVGGEDWWLIDSGVSFGLSRSPVNLDRTGTQADYYHRYRVSDATITESVSEIPVVTFTQPPLQDIAGYDDGVFFEVMNTIRKGTTEVIYRAPLRNLIDVYYQFEENHFKWLELETGSSEILRPVQTLNLDRTNVILETLYGVSPNASGGLFLAETGGDFEFQIPNVDYLLDETTGTATLVEAVGGFVGRGFAGYWSGGGTTLTNVFLTGLQNFLTMGAAVGYRVKIASGDSAGSYIVQSVTDGNRLEVAPAFPADSGSLPMAWEIYEDIPVGTYNPAIVVDTTSVNFNHLPNETYQIKVLTALGLVPVDATAQATARLQADMADSRESGRIIALRYGLNHGATADISAQQIAANTATLGILPAQELGVAANDSLFIPGSADTDPDHVRFANQAFQIRIGSDVFQHGSGLLAVVEFSLNPVAIEYLTSTGEMKFNSTLLEIYASARVRFEGIFLAPALLPSRTVEYDQWGNLNINASDLAEFGADTAAYFVEQMVTEANLDVVVNPVNGGINFAKPLGEYKIVEAEYYQAGADGNSKKLDSNGDPIFRLDFLPLYVRLENCTRVSGNKYTFNPPDANGVTRTLFTDVEPTVYRDTILANFGKRDTLFDYATAAIQFQEAVPASTVVKASYAVLESFGGEQAYSVPAIPVYRPPFYIGSGVSDFTLLGDRTGDVLPGMLLRLGAAPFYIKTSAYNGVTDLTTVGIYPSTTSEAGSRAPGKDVLCVITDRPVTSTVDAEHHVAVTGADDGYMLTVTQDWEPADRGQSNVAIEGNLLQWTVPGHLLEMGGCPYIIASADMNDDMTKTIITVTCPFLRGYRSYKDTIRISVRPVYPPEPRDFIGIAPVYQNLPVELVMWGETGSTGNTLPGRTLTRGVDYEIDFTTGGISLLDPAQASLQPGQKLTMRYTKERILSPTQSGGMTVIPRVKYRYRYATTPTDTNGYLGAYLKGTYTLHSPDSCYCRVLPLEAFSGEVASDILEENKTVQGTAKGPLVPFVASPDNSDAGLMGIDSKRTELTDGDRAARSFLDFYCQVVGGMEQIKETITGEIVGDRDGKFRFFVGRGMENAPPGYEDEFTGILNPRSIFSEIFQDEAPSWDIPLLLTDNVVDPMSAYLSGGLVWGNALDSNALDYLIERQRSRIGNDIDDIVLTSLGKMVGVMQPYPITNYIVSGVYSHLYDPNTFSRIYPEQSRGYLTTYPGIESDVAAADYGSYSYLRLVDWDWQRTWNKPIGQIGNPVIPEITNIRDVVISKRLPRARVWGYFPNGIPQDALGVGYPAAAISSPCVIATPLHLPDFPVNPDTSWPDAAQLQAQNVLPPAEAFADLTTGDSDRNVPPWQHPINGLISNRAQVAFGRPNGSLFAVGSPQQLAGTNLSGVFVYEVLHGCIITFKTLNAAGADTPILVANQLVELQTPSIGTTLVVEKGDTIYVIPPSGSAETTANPPTEEDYAKMADAAPAYREGFDVGLKKKSGVLIDKSLPGGSDPILLTGFDLQSWFGQSPPKPGEALEVDVEFGNSRTSPLLIPALLGLDTDDTGDYSIPFLGGPDTELMALGDAHTVIGDILTVVSAGSDPVVTPPPVLPPTWEFVYPDEILANDGSILAALSGDLSPAALLTTQVYDPITNTTLGNAWAIGEEDARAYDLLLMEWNTGTPELPGGSQGILSIGRVQRNGLNTHSMIEPPRFVTQTGVGDAIKYTLDNFVGYMDDETPFTWVVGDPPPPLPPTTSGLSISVDSTPANEILLLDFSTTPQLSLDDGWGGVGGLNTILAADAANFLKIRIFVRGALGTYYPGDYARFAVSGNAIYIYGDGRVIADLNTPGLVATITGKQITIIGAGASLVLALAGHAELPSTLVGAVRTTDYEFDYTISLSTSVGHSNTAWIADDRLSFKECVDTRYALDRTFRHAYGKQAMGCGLSLGSCVVEGDATSAINNGINGGIAYPLTFLERDTTALETNTGVTRGVGVWTPASAAGAGDELGILRAMGFEGFNPNGAGAGAVATATATLVEGQIDTITIVNGGAGYDGGHVYAFIVDGGGAGYGFEGEVTVNAAGEVAGVTILNPGHGYVAPDPLTFVHMIGNYAVEAMDATFSMVPSQAYDEVETFLGDGGIICDGTGLIQDPVESVITNVSVLAGLGGDLSKVVPGDVVVIEEGSTVAGTIKAGTFLVRHAVDPSNYSPGAGGALDADPVRALTLTSVAGGGGWVDIKFPKIASSDTIKIDIVSSSNANPAVITTATAHGLGVGDQVFISGHTENSLNGTFLVAALHGISGFDIGIAGTGGTGGTVSIAALAIDWINDTVRVDTFYPAPGSATGFRVPPGPPAPRVYFVTLLNGIASEVVSAEYSAIVGTTFSIVNGSYLDHTGAGMTQAAFYAALQKGQTVSGMCYFPIEMGGSDPGLPSNNVVGFTDDVLGAPLAAYGFAGITITQGAGFQEFMYGPYGAPLTFLPITTAAGTLEAIFINTTAMVASTAFITNPQTPVYDNVPTSFNTVDFKDDGASIVGDAWHQIRTNFGVTCWLPGDVISTTATFTPAPATPVEPNIGPHGFWAKSGIFTEPSWPLPAQNLVGLTPRVVSASTPAVTAAEIGFRTGGYDETVAFQVRRIRRFHELQTDLDSYLHPLRYAYEIRRGHITGYSVSLKQIGIVNATNFQFLPESPYYRNGMLYNGTQLGGFDDESVNIRSGDTFRLWRVDTTVNHPRPKTLVEEARVLRVVDSDTLHLASPGLTDAAFLADVALGNYDKYWFEIYLKQPIIPQEQSAEQLLDLITDEVVTETLANYTTQKGGYVLSIVAGGYDVAYNKLKDDKPGAGSFITRGVQVGDIVLIDGAGRLAGPKGVLAAPEWGSRPFGDMSVAPRETQDVTFYTEGTPSVLDDNRGFYYVTQVAATQLGVDGTNIWGGIKGSDIIFPEDTSAQEEHGYAIYPTVHGSLLSADDDEGQCDLRPTMLAGLDDTGAVTANPDSFADSNHSIRPFSYKVIRPTSLLSSNAINFILANRERTLSLIEQFRSVTFGDKGGTYYIFQRDDHIGSLGVLGIPDTGMGVYSNSVLEDVIGQVFITPFGSDRDCLSILDRRFWGMDERLDDLTSDGTGFGLQTAVVPGDTPYTGYSDVTSVPAPAAVRPVLTDWVDYLLDTSDRIRALRNSWLTIRTDIKRGTLGAISRFDAEIPELKQKEQDYILQKKGLDEI